MSSLVKRLWHRFNPSGSHRPAAQSLASLCLRRDQRKTEKARQPCWRTGTRESSHGDYRRIMISSPEPLASAYWLSLPFFLQNCARQASSQGRCP